MKRAMTVTALSLIFMFTSLGTSAWAIDDVKDSFQCYSLKKETKIDPPTVNLTDQFGERLDVGVNKKADMFCTPVNIDGHVSAYVNYTLTCYKVDKEKLKNTIYVTNQFDESELGQSFKTKKAELVCVPSFIDAP